MLLADGRGISFFLLSFLRGTALCAFHVFLYFSQQVAGEDEGVEFLVGGTHYFVLRAFPLLASVADVENALAYAKNGVHIVCVDDGCHAVFVGDATDEVVDDEARLGVETRVGFVAEQILGVEGNGSCYGNTLLHAAAYLARHLALGTLQVDSLKAEAGTLHAVGLVHVGEHVEWKHDILQYRHGVEECCTLEDHAHLASKHDTFTLRHRHEVASVVEDFAFGGCEKAYDVLHQDCLSGAGLTDDEVGLSVAEGHVDVGEDVSAIETLV